MGILKLLSLLLLVILSCCSSYQADLYDYSKIICQSVCDNILRDEPIFSSEVEMARDLLISTINSQSVIDVADSMGGYSWGFKQKHFETWLGFRVLRNYSGSLSKKFKLPFSQIVSGAFPSSSSCQPCLDEADGSSLTQAGPQLVKPSMSLVLIQVIKDTLQEEFHSKPKIDLPINVFPSYQSLLSSGSRRLLPPIPSPQQHMNAVCMQPQVSAAEQAQCLNQLIRNYIEQLNDPQLRPDLRSRDEVHLREFQGQEGFFNGAANIRHYAQYGNELLGIYDVCKDTSNSMLFDTTC